MFNKKQKIIIISFCIVSIIVLCIGSIVFYNFGKKANNIAEFQTYLNEYQVNSQKYILGKNESIHTGLINESVNAITKKDANKTVELKSKLKQLEGKIVAENTDSLNNGLKKIAGIDISKLSENKKKEITSMLKKISVLISNKKFRSASTNLEEVRKIINNELKLIVDDKNKKAAKLAEEIEKNKNLTLEDARKLIFKEDNDFANKEINSGSELHGDDPHNTKMDIYGIDEGVYSFIFSNPNITENDGLTSFYYVGKDSKNVYRCSSVGGAGGDLYLIENNKIVKTLKYSNNTASQNNVNSLGQLSSSEALKKVQQSYPDYTYIDGGSIDNEAFNDRKGIAEPAYLFKFSHNTNKDIYVAWVFADGGIKFRCVARS